jgi:hypothetical protein
MHKLIILYNSIIGHVIKTWYVIFNSRLTKTNICHKKEEIIISLTSYGRRVQKVLPITLISLIKQKCQADKIIVWLDRETWNDDNLPISLIKLKKFGVEFRFCEDIRSYTKLVPTLIAFPKSIIITVDDDIYYKEDLTERLYKSYLKAPNNIHTAIAHKPLRDEFGKLINYNKWQMNIKSAGQDEEIFPTGVGGCLYPPGSLYPDVTNKDLFKLLCPFADDVWFWVMAKLQNTKHTLVKAKQNYPLDLFYEITHSGASLRHENVLLNANDKQIKQVFKHYSLK